LIFNDAVRFHPEWATALKPEGAPKTT
jgi:hypothetical protein